MFTEVAGEAETGKLEVAVEASKFSQFFDCVFDCLTLPFSDSVSRDSVLEL